MSTNSATSTRSKATPDSANSNNTDSLTESKPDSRFWRSPRFQTWLDRRVPPSNSITLGQKNIFILPTRQGMYFTVLIIFMMLAGINYQNSLIFALAFLLISLFMVSILHTFRNLSGLTLQGQRGQSVFAGEDVEFNVTLTRTGNRTFEAIQLGWQPEFMRMADLLDTSVQQYKVYATSKHRGRFNPGRILVQTYYPVGLFRAWSWVDLDLDVTVYPKPINAGSLPEASEGADEGEMARFDGVDDFHGLREYHLGDPTRHIAWKVYARTEQLQIKEFSAFVDRRVWLNWESLQGLDREARLSRLAWWVLQLSASSDEYGLRLPNLEIQPSKGVEHKNALLSALALFELDSLKVSSGSAGSTATKSGS